MKKSFIFLVMLVLLSSFALAQTCSDSDGGDNPDVFGDMSVEYINPIDGRLSIDNYGDFCSGDNLKEFYCMGDQNLSAWHTCESGCKEGACLPNTIVNDLKDNLPNEDTASTIELEQKDTDEDNIATITELEMKDMDEDNIATLSELETKDMDEDATSNQLELISKDDEYNTANDLPDTRVNVICSGDTDKRNFFKSGKLVYGADVLVDKCDDEKHLLEYYCKGEEVCKAYVECDCVKDSGACRRGSIFNRATPPKIIEDSCQSDKRPNKLQQKAERFDLAKGQKKMSNGDLVSIEKGFLVIRRPIERAKFTMDGMLYRLDRNVLSLEKYDSCAVTMGQQQIGASKLIVQKSATINRVELDSKAAASRDIGAQQIGATKIEAPKKFNLGSGILRSILGNFWRVDS